MRRLHSLLLVAVLAGGCGGAPDDGVRVLGAREARGTVSGVVRRAGVGVAGAQVSLTGRAVVADASGAYRFGDVAPGRHRLEARDPGDDTVSCTPSGACVSGRSAAQVAVAVVVPPEGGDVVVDVEL